MYGIAAACNIILPDLSNRTDTVRLSGSMSEMEALESAHTNFSVMYTWYLDLDDPWKKGNPSGLVYHFNDNATDRDRLHPDVSSLVTSKYSATWFFHGGPSKQRGHDYILYSTIPSINVGEL